MRFYAQRDGAPGRWYGRDARGRTVPFDDLPARYHGNVNTEPPFGQHRGDRPALSEAEIRDVVAFLKTLTDADQLPPSNSTSASISTGMSKGSSAEADRAARVGPTSGP